MEFKFKKGYDINIKCISDNKIYDYDSDTVAFVVSDFKGIKPRLSVKVGDKVKIGTPLLFDRINKNIKIVSSVSGKVSSILVGEYGILKAIIIENDNKYNSINLNTFKLNDLKLNCENILNVLLKTGGFPFFRKRPFNEIADPLVKPRDIFISCFNSKPLSPESDLIIKSNEKYFNKGLEVVGHLTDGKVYLGFPSDKKECLPLKIKNSDKVEINYFPGKHPAGNVGVQIHHTKPIRNYDDIVWHCDINSLIIIGRLFLDENLSFKKIISVSDLINSKRKYYNVVNGTKIKNLFLFDLDDNLRFISGDILSGRNCSLLPYIGFYDDQFLAIKEPTKDEFLGWLKPGFTKESFSRTFISGFIKRFKSKFDSNVNGSKRAFINNDIYSKVLPMDIYPVFLIKSIMAKDIDEMEGLGIYELVEEDIALCEYICPSKISFQTILRDGLNYIKEENIG